MNEAKKNVINYINNNKECLKSKEVTIGIDAFIDKIVQVVQTKPAKGEYIFFKDIDQFGKYIVSKSGKSCTMEIKETLTKLGGNAPIMANAIGSLGVKVNCIGALGYPDIDAIFNNKLTNCTLFSIGNPGYTTALEFEDGKIMLSQRDSLNIIGWEEFKKHLGIDNIKNFFNRSNVIGMVNWTGMTNFNDILKGIIDEVIPLHKANNEQVMYFDFADFSDRTKDDISEALNLLNKLAEHYKVILGLNENETTVLKDILLGPKEKEDWVSKGEQIYNYLNIDALVVHTVTNSIVWHEDGNSQVGSLFVKRPKLSTGGGDNFNAGLCFGQLIGLDYEGSLYCANATSGFYVRNGKSPNIDELIYTLENWEKLVEEE